MTRSEQRLVGIALSLQLVVAGVAWFYSPTPPPCLTLAPAGYDQFVGWRKDGVAAALPALLRSCATVLKRRATAAIDARTKNFDFGGAADWRGPCEAAAAVPAGDDTAAREFFETRFAPFLATNQGFPDGLFTGYFELTLDGSRKRGGPYQTPLYRRPPGSERTRYTRGEIDDGVLGGKGLELLWVSDPVAAFFLEIQGSGLVRLPDGSAVRVGYDGSNAKRYVAVGRLLIERGVMPRSKVTMAGIEDWMRAHPRDGAALRRENPSYVFFREIHGPGPLGAERVALSAGRSLAVDRAFVPLGVPIWLDARERFFDGRIQRLVIAQDTGGAIKGPVRGDLFWGHGKEAGAGAGAMNASGRYYLLLPKPVALRIAAAH